MSTERIIQVADLTFILNALSNVRSDIGAVSGQVESVGQELGQTRSELSRLEQAFADFVAADLKAKELALAETRQVKLRQEIETSFGYYAEVRRHATGILQAADVNLVRQETIRSATEELMLSTPRYWLAPALVALSAWLSDNQALAARALAEAVRRDDEKTSLFFALICRRAGRMQALAQWLERYFGLQDPHKLDRQTVVMIDAVANGVFGADAGMQCAKRIAAWIEELAQQAGFVAAQRTQWRQALQSKTPNGSHAARYAHLARLSPTWAAMEKSLNAVSMHAVVLEHFEGIFAGSIAPAASLLVAVDDLLSKLVTRFDDEELPLRRKDELCTLIIDEAGDRRAAQRRFDLQCKALDEQVDFTQLLTNAAMHPETSHASRATQRLAVAHSRDWVVDAHADLAAQIRMEVPGEIEVAIEDWSGRTTRGDNERELTSSLQDHIRAREAAALAQVKLGLKQWGALALGVLLVFMALSHGFVVLAFGAACIGWFFMANNELKKKRQKLKDDYARLLEQSTQALRAVLAEVVEWRRDVQTRDAVAPRVTELLQSISPEQYMLSSHDSVRRVMAGVN